MKRITFLLFAIACVQLHAKGQNLLSGKYTADQLAKILIPRPEWTPFPRITDRAGWAKADQTMMKSFFDKGMSYINYE